MFLLNNSDNNTQNALQTYCDMVDAVIGKLATFVRNEIHDAQAVGYTKNFSKFRDAIAFIAIQNQEKPEHVVHKMHACLKSKTFRDNKSKLEILHNTINTLFVDETVELKNSLQKMKLPTMCRKYIFNELDAHRRQCVRE